jgi:hypothetical protein
VVSAQSGGTEPVRVTKELGVVSVVIVSVRTVNTRHDVREYDCAIFHFIVSVKLSKYF